ncbi:hypothetical protein BD847_0075 [Flavobacterium cutihirudinis]|uniref:Uncharacterized protein n=1 Tax=Flavobacterium cutihirudinis TaxID=1265740 RepID=A0A3D9FYY9_9FLAO|nr:hypothetical protein BD847_0075 [Flavobacterium cutihirudinis]
MVFINHELHKYFLTQILQIELIFFTLEKIYTDFIYLKLNLLNQQNLRKKKSAQSAKSVAKNYCKTSCIALAFNKHSSYSFSGSESDVMALPTENETYLFS